MTVNPTGVALDWMSMLPVTQLWATLRPHRAWRLPAAPGVTVRGAWLRTLTEAGLATAWWKGEERTPARWWLSVEPPPDGRVGPEAPLLVRWGAVGPVPEPVSMLRGLLVAARRGLGPRRVPHTVEQVWAQGAGTGAMVVRDHDVVGPWPLAGRLGQLVDVPEAPTRAVVRLRSPFAGPRRVSPEEWIGAAIGRVRGLARALDLRLPVRWPSPRELHGEVRDLQSHRGSRKSRSQPGHQDLSGWTGALHLRGPSLTHFADLVSAAEVLQVGRRVTFGLGVVRVSWD